MVEQADVVRLVDVSARFGVGTRHIVVAAIEAEIPIYYRRQGARDPLTAVQHATADDYQRLLSESLEAEPHSIDDWRTCKWDPAMQFLDAPHGGRVDSFDKRSAMACWLFRHPMPHERPGLRCVTNKPRLVSSGIKVTAEADYFIAAGNAELLATKGEWRQGDDWSNPRPSANVMSVDDSGHGYPGPRGPSLGVPPWLTEAKLAALFDAQHVNHAPDLFAAIHLWADTHSDAKNRATIDSCEKSLLTIAPYVRSDSSRKRVAQVANPLRLRRAGERGSQKTPSTSKK